jgi:hydroxymethylpyrimidine/phosphomethylpyrimidine kinase
LAINPRTTPGLSVALSIAGSDSSGGAGVQADLKIFTVMGVYGAGAITAVAAQNTTGVKHLQAMDAELVEQQIDAVSGDFDIGATKVGLLPNPDIVDVVASAVKRQNLLPLVVDPSMVAKSGAELVDQTTIDRICKSLLPLAAIVTPNRAEAARLLGRAQPIADVAGAIEAGRQIVSKFGVRACLIKGFRRTDGKEDEAVDVYHDSERTDEVFSQWRPTENTHGAGCVLSAAITAGLAQGMAPFEAVCQAKAVVGESIRQSTDLGAGAGPVNHGAYLKVKK